MKFSTLLLSISIIIAATELTAIKIGVSRTTTYNTTITSTSTTTSTVLPTDNELISTTPASFDATTTEDFTILQNNNNNSISTTSTTALHHLPPTFPPRKTLTTAKQKTLKPTINTLENATSDALNLTEQNATLNENHRNKLAHYYCSCDLHENFCDLNCCCDFDCEKAILKVFNCQTTDLSSELHSRLENFQYAHGLPSCKINDGWLCVFRVNKPPEREQWMMPNLDTTNYNKWPESLNIESLKERKHLDLGYYKFGEPIQILQMDTMELQNFDLPVSFKLPHCQIMEPIQHLKSLQTSCLVETHEEMLENIYNIFNITQNAKILKVPNSDEPQRTENLAEILCCYKFKDTELNCQNTTELDLNVEEYSIDLILKIVHNYTHIQGALLLFEVNNIIDNTEEIWQHFSVNFIYQNLTEINAEQIEFVSKLKSSEKPISGPLGYIQGAPLIISEILKQTEKEEEKEDKQILNYFQHNNSNYHLLPLPIKRQGLCHKTYESQDAIHFGINIAKQCNLQQNTLTFTKNNYTAYCEQLQMNIFAQLLPHGITKLEQLKALYISKLGRPSMDLTMQWLQLQLKNYDETTAQIEGDFNAQTQTINCRNIMLSFGYEFHIGTYTFQGKRHQRLLQHAAFVLGQRKFDLEFERGEQLELPLTLTVMFYDLSAQNQRSNAAAKNIGVCIWRMILLLQVLRIFIKKIYKTK